MSRPHGVSFARAVSVWARVAALSFGGPAGQIATMHRIVVEEERWVGEARFLHALSYCTLLPGPEAQQLATYLGWLMHGVRGGLAAGTLFVLPGAVSVLALSIVYARWGQIGPVAGLFFGVKAAVLAIVLQAVVRLGGRALRSRLLLAIAGASFVAIFAFSVPFPLIILAAACAGGLGVWAGPPQAPASDGLSDAESLLGELALGHAQRRGAKLAGLLCLVLWLGPVGALLAWLGQGATFTQIGLFFSKMAVVTFGGAYAALAYVAQQAVAHYGWLRPGEMLDGLGLAETTPGPLIMVLQFVGYLAAYRAPDGLAPGLAGILGALLTTWVTFVPCFAWIFLGAPYVEALRQNLALSGALAGITASVVGVILNLAVWFALHFWFAGGELARVDWVAMLLSAFAAALVFWRRAGMVMTLGCCAVLGIVLHEFGAG